MGLVQSNRASVDEGDFSFMPFDPEYFEPAFLTSDASLGSDNLAASGISGIINASPQISDCESRLPPVTKAPGLSLNRFEAYVEDTLGSYAPSFQNGRQTQRLPLAKQHTDGIHVSCPTESSSARSGGAGHLYPLEVNMASRSTIDLEHQVVRLDSADMDYLKAKGAFDLPPRTLQEDLVEAFFADVHPTAPVINKAEFLSEFYGKGSPSRLLLFAMFTSGSRACRNPALLDSKGTNQGSAQQFYKATKVRLSS